MAAERLLKLARFVEHFKKSDLWKAMAACKEDSPWHREDSVAIHTEMVCAEFEKIAERMTMLDTTYIVTYLSLLFHDTGKPPCKVVKFKPERGHYNAFHGHEPYSARLFEDYYVANHRQFAGWLSPDEAYKVMWMVENHLPYDYMGNDKKMDYLRTAMAGNLGEQWVGFGWHLLSDTYGRISDDSAAKRAKTETFVDMMNSANVNEPRFTEENAPTVLLLIGASGSGKSTYVKEKVAEGYAHFSYDDIRIELAEMNGAIKKPKDSKDEYRQAFAYCDKHRSEFGHFADVQFIKLVKDYRSVVVDNTNTSRKTRTKFVEAVKRRGYKIEAAMFPVDKETLMTRLHSRTDKSVPDDAVIRQYHGIQIPWVGVEVDKMHILETNLDKK